MSFKYKLFSLQGFSWCLFTLTTYYCCCWFSVSLITFKMLSSWIWVWKCSELLSSLKEEYFVVLQSLAEFAKHISAKFRKLSIVKVYSCKKSKIGQLQKFIFAKKIIDLLTWFLLYFNYNWRKEIFKNFHKFTVSTI